LICFFGLKRESERLLKLIELPLNRSKVWFRRIIFISVILLLEHMRTFTATSEKDEDMHVARCPEVGTASQGRTIKSALASLKQATELYLEEFHPPAPNTGKHKIL